MQSWSGDYIHTLTVKKVNTYHIIVISVRMFLQYVFKGLVRERKKIENNKVQSCKLLNTKNTKNK